MDPSRPVTVELSDPGALLAYAHPLRLRLVGLLRQHATLTATQAAELLGESSGSCSFHLRRLAHFGLVEEVPARGRAKPWRATAQRTEWQVKRDDPAFEAATRALSSAAVDLYADTARDWVSRRAQESEAWREAAWLGDHLISCSPEELAGLRAQIDALLEPFIDRRAQERRPDDRLVDIVSIAVPMSQPR